MNNNGSSFKDFYEIKKMQAQNRLSKLKIGFQEIYDYSLMSNGLK